MSTGDHTGFDSSLLLVQINAYDAYQDTSTSFTNSPTTPNPPDFDRAPILRIFGSFPTGHSVLVHVHNVYPYLFIDFSGPVTAVEQKCLELRCVMEAKLQESFSPKKTRTRSTTSNSPPLSFAYVAGVLVVQATPFYGFHPTPQPYYKVHLLSAAYVTRLAKILQGTGMQPYEAHIPYAMQFLTDFNLHACGWLRLSRCYIRTPVLDARVFNLKGDMTGTHQHHIPSLQDYLSLFMLLNLLKPDHYPRMGKTVAEIDVDASWILNRYTLHERPMPLYEPYTGGAGRSITALEELSRDIAFQRQQRGYTQPAEPTPQRTMTAEFVAPWMTEEMGNLFEQAVQKSSALYRQRSSKPLTRETLASTTLTLPFKFAAVELELRPVNIPPEECFSWTPTKDMLYKPMSAKGAVPIPVEVTVSHEEVGAINDWSEPDGNEDSDMEKPDAPLPGQEKPDQEDPDQEEPDQEDPDQEEPDQEDPDQEEPDQEGPDQKERDEKEPGEKEPGRKGLDQEEPNQPNWRLPPPSSTPASPLPGLLDLRLFHQSQRKRKHSLLLDSYPFTSTQRSDSTSGMGPFQAQGAVYEPAIQPPDALHLMDEFEMFGLLRVDYPDPFYSRAKDLPVRPAVFSGRKFTLRATELDHLPKVRVAGVAASSTAYERLRARPPQPVFGIAPTMTWEYIPKPPSYGDVELACKPPVSLASPHVVAPPRVARRPDGYTHLSCFGVELFIPTAGHQPDPACDAVKLIFYKFDNPNAFAESDNPGYAMSGVLAVGDQEGEDNVELTEWSRVSKLTGISIVTFPTEVAMISKLLWLVMRFDPDILTGFELHARSWGYLVDRFSDVYATDLCEALSRVTKKTNNKKGDRWGYTHASAIRITGRHMLNTWRHVRGSVALTSYTLENLAFHLLNERVPKYPENQLKYGSFREKLRVVRYYRRRVSLNFRLIDKQELITGTTEQARLTGIDFYSVFYRGSQFKVEAFLTRLTKAANFIMLSPDQAQVRKQKPLECVPLIMEPESGFYKSPLVVLDFQSLYPSIMVAFNYCYSTIIGPLRGFSPKGNRIGVTNVKLKPGVVGAIRDDIVVSPTGMMYCNAKVRKSVLAIMLEELLETRVMVKASMKELKGDTQLVKLYNSRQLALKLIANVTYGYASASYSGRMPCSDVADSIVQTGRELLSRSIDIIESGPWGAKVVYGDTDSLFVYFPGKSKDDAFRFGRAMAVQITDQFPNPVKLKFEKVYHPCVLLAKKRYVGYAYEWEDQTVPKFDAKGIETVRRDGVPAQAHMVEKTLRTLFETLDVSQIKAYVQHQFKAIMNNEVSVKDFCFAKEVRLGTYKSLAHLPPGAVVSMKKVAADPKAAPQYRERVPYVVIKGLPKATLRSRCLPPEALLADASLALDSHYYITKVLIPPLERILNLMGVDVKPWYRDLPRTLALSAPKPRGGDKQGVSGVVRSNACACCRLDLAGDSGVCAACRANEMVTVARLQHRVSLQDTQLRKIALTCYTCASANYNSADGYADCISGDCPVYYDRVKALQTAHAGVEPQILREW